MEIGFAFALMEETAVGGGDVVTVGVVAAVFVFFFPRGLDFARAIFFFVFVFLLRRGNLCVAKCFILQMDDSF